SRPPERSSRRDVPSPAAHVTAGARYQPAPVPRRPAPRPVQDGAARAGPCEPRFVRSGIWLDQPCLRASARAARDDARNVQPRRYAEIARAIGAPSATRAVARACATNPVALVIPCHRVVRADGGLGGYRWGVARKRSLLEQERATTAN